MRLSTASQPIHWVPPTTGTPSRVVANFETMKLLFSAQSYVAVADSPFSFSPVHSPISHSMSSRWSAFEGGWGSVSWTLCRYH